MPTYGGFLRYADKQKEQHMKQDEVRQIDFEGEIRFVKFREPD
jgi:hypothetical protein